MLCLHELPGGSDPAAGNADVDVGMEGQLLAPCMEDRDDPGLRSKELRVGAQGEQRLLHTFKLQIQEDLQIRLDQRPEIMRDSEYDMKVGDPFDQFRVALQLPLLFQGCLAAGTGAVVAGDSVDQEEPAVFTEAYVVTEATGLAAHDTQKRELLAALIKEHDVKIFEHDELLSFLTDRGSRNSIENFFRFIETLDGNTLTARQAAGLLAVWLDCTHYYPEKKSLFEALIPLCEKKITDSLLLIDDALYLSNDGAYIDSIAGLASAQILMRYGTSQSPVWQAVARMLVTSLLRYSGDSAGLPVGFTVTGEKTTQLALIADDSRILDAGILYPLVIPDNTWYPHAQSLALQAEAGIWAWTCAQHIEVLENTSRTLLLRVRFPEGQSHYLTLHGIRPFYRIELYGIPFRSDARLEMYNSSGYTYNAGSRILYLKMRHKSEYEMIRLSFGSAPQQKPTQPVVQPSPEQPAPVGAPAADTDSSTLPAQNSELPAASAPVPEPEVIEPTSQVSSSNE